MKIKSYRCLRMMCFRVGWLIALVTMVAGQDLTFSVPNRNITQRAALCASSRQIKTAWDKIGSYPNGYPVQTKPSTDWGKGRCLQILSTSIPVGIEIWFFVSFSAVCRQAKATKWNWALTNFTNAAQSKTLRAGSKSLLGDTTTTFAVESPRFSWDTFPPAVIKQNYQPMICACGYDYTDSGTCLDIDECKENHQCPTNSTCRNTKGSYECRCNTAEGYANLMTSLSLVQPGGSCGLLAVRYNATNIDTTSFVMSLTGLGGTAHYQLFVVDDNGGKNDNPENKGFVTLVKDVSQLLNFSGMNPGMRYQVMMKYNTSVTEYWSEIVITKCYSLIVDDDDTGVPDEVESFQDNGYITFKFIDNSLCEEAYSFIRGRLDEYGEKIVSKEVFAPDYYFFSGKPREPYDPGRQAADNLRLSNLTVGTTYSYGIRASSRQDWRTSNWTQINHTVLWQASVDGQVTLHPKTGRLPVPGVTVEYRLEDLNGTSLGVVCTNNATDGWCQTETSVSGKFQIEFSLNHPSLNNSDEFPLRMRFSKTSGTVQHQFLCNDGILDCTSKNASQNATRRLNVFDAHIQSSTPPTEMKRSSMIVHLRHLDFQQPVFVIDDTAVPFRGTIVVSGTSYGAGILGCPITDAEVCVEEHSARNKVKVQNPICVKTKWNGEYELPAVIGTLISPKVNYRNHTFEPINPKHELMFEDGISIEPGVTYEGYNLQDVTRANVTIEVAGGLCDRYLGKAEIRLTMENCGWKGIVLSQNVVLYEHDVIAQKVNLRVENISGANGDTRQDILTDLSSKGIKIDLRELDKGENRPKTDGGIYDKALNTNNTEAKALADEKTQQEENTKTNKARFQFDGTDVITPLFYPTLFRGITSCGTQKQSASYSYIVMGAYKPFELMVFLEQDFGDDIPKCSKYPAGTNVTIMNQVGASEGNDAAWLAKLREMQIPEERLERLSLCSSPCSLELKMDKNSGDKAKVAVQLETGQPNPIANYTKSIIISKDGTQHTVDVVLVGDYEESDGVSIALPTHEPLLVLRDPPGGGSYSYYENVVTTISVEIEQSEVFEGFDANANFGFGSYEYVIMCEGLLLMECNLALQEKWSASVDVGGGADFQTETQLKQSKSATWTTTWSYNTGSDPWSAGKASDVFLVPNINVMYKNVQEVSWTNNTCGKAETKLKYTLNSPDNKGAIGFLSRYDIDNVEIPELIKLKNSSEQVLLDNKCQTEPKQNENSNCTAARSNKFSLESSIAAWKNFLEVHDNTTSLAADGKLEKRLYLKDLNKANDEKEATDSKKHYSGLITKQMLDSAVPLKDAQSNILDSINMIRFDGGGSELRFELTKEMLEEHIDKIGPPQDNSKGRFFVKGKFKTEITILGVDVDVEVGGEQHTEVEKHHTLGSTSSDRTAVGFVLSDPDRGDVFDVEVFVDPRYGTFIFHTASGRSLCPHEKGTAVRELPKIVVIKQPSGLLLPDATMVFEVELTNAGISASSFMLFMDNRANTGLLYQTLTAPKQYYEIGSGETIRTTVALTRGPVQYDYPAMPVEFASSCTYAGFLTRNLDHKDMAWTSVDLFNVMDGNSPRIRFAEPCPGIHWAGDLGRERSFQIIKGDIKSGQPAYTLLVVIQNPASAYSTYQDILNAPLSRFKSASLWYRSVGQSRWSLAVHRPSGSGSSVDVDFVGLNEDKFGYISVKWDVSSLADGEYELEARTICRNGGNTLPSDFNSVVTERLTGVIDRVEPKLFGSPIPNAGHLLHVGETTRFVFTEPLLCSRPFLFEAVARVSNMTRIFDNSVNNNLLVTCEDRTISVAFDPTQMDLSDLQARNITFKLKGVQDLHGNPTDPLHPISHVVRVATNNLTAASIFFQLDLNHSFDIPNRRLVELPLLTNIAVEHMVARAAHVPVERVRVSSSVQTNSASQSSRASYMVHIHPASSAEQGDANVSLNSITAYHYLTGNLTSVMEGVEYSLFTPNIRLGEKDMQARRRMLETPNDGNSRSVEWEHELLDALQESASAQHDSTSAVEKISHEMEDAVEKMNHVEDAVEKLSHEMEDAVEKMNHVEDAVEKIRHEVEDAVEKIRHDVEDAVGKMSHRLGDMEVQLNARMEGLETLIREELMTILRVVEKKSSGM